MTAIGKTQHEPYIYAKSKKCETFLYKTIQTLCKKQDNSRYVFNPKRKTLYVTQFFMKILKLAFAYKKDDTLCYVSFLYTKIQTLRKKHDHLRYVFIYKKLDTLRYASFH